MTVLDLDLDFFQKGRKTDGFCGQSDGVSAWSQDQVRDFLENNLKLDKNKKIKGKIVNKHHEAFLYWSELIDKGLLSTPFSIDHVDAHSDLGFGGTWWNDFFNRLVYAYYDKPNDFPTDGMNEGNYLCYAIAKQWVQKLNYIYNDTVKDFDGCDVFVMMWKDAKIGGNFLQICQYAPALDWQDMSCGDFSRALSKRRASAKEVPFSRYAGKTFSASSSYDYINLAVSPGYIVEDSKKNIDVIKEYMDIT